MASSFLFIERFPALVPPLIIFLLAFFIAFHVTLLMRAIAPHCGLMDHPGGRKTHAAPIPCSGGVAIVCGVLVSLLLTYGNSPQIHAILAAGVGIAVVGFLDDLYGVSAPIKLLALAVACLALSTAGIGLNRTPYPVLNYALTFLWIAGVSSAFNAIDNTDGLAGSICVISGLAIFLLGWSTWQIGFSFLAMALAGSVLGFLHHNIPRARIYMGDTGSFFLGYILAVLVIFGEWSESGMRSFLSGCFVLALPIFDLGLTTLLRARHGIISGLLEALSHSDRDHLSHRLQHMGFSQGRMLAILCLLSVACCEVALIIVSAPGPVAAVVVGLAVLMLGWFGLHLDRRTSLPGLWVHGKPKSATR